MERRIGRELEVGSRAVVFIEANPDEHPVNRAFAEGFVGLVGHGGELATQVRVLRDQRNAALKLKYPGRDELRAQLDLLQGFTDAAMLRRPELGLDFRLPPRSIGKIGFGAQVRSIAALATAHRAVLVSYGMPDQMPEQLVRRMDQIELAERQRADAQQRLTGARAELREVAREIRAGLRHLDAIYRVRFAGNTEKLAAWKSARERRGPMPEKEAGSGQRPAA